MLTRTWVCNTNSLYRSGADSEHLGRHRIRYAIMPHTGALDSRTVRTAYNFNHPMRLVSSTSGNAVDTSIFRAITVDGNPSLILDCIKRGEDDEDVSRGDLPKRKGRSIILRVYESMGGTSRGLIQWDSEIIPVKQILRTNILEDDREELEIGADDVMIQLRPFEVATYRLQL